jgi:hypothetical protein
VICRVACQKNALAEPAETTVMDEYRLTVPDLQLRLGEIIRRMKKIQRSIRASRQPASRLELMELKDLGLEYARIVEQLADSPDAGPD